VLSAGVFGLADDHWGEIVSAAVVLRPGAAPAAEALIAHVRALKGPVQAPKRLFFLPNLPLTPLGKPDKKALRRIASTASS
jgi:fatty-acyl-CoA synthase